MAYKKAIILDFGESFGNIASVTLPKLHVSAVMEQKNVGSSEATLPLPKLNIDSLGIKATLPTPTLSTGFWVDNTKTTLPSLKLTAIAEKISSDVITTLPVFKLTATGITGGVGNSNITFPSITVYAKDPEKGTVNITIPSLIITAIGSHSEVGTINIKIPQFTLSVEGSRGEVGESDANLPLFKLNANGLTGRIGICAAKLPIIRSEGSSYWYINATGTANLVLPVIKLEAFGQTILSDIYDVYVLNTKNFALSRYTNYGFNSFAKFGNLYLAANQNGIFLLDGTNDDGTNIDAEITTGLISGGTDRLKRAIDMIIGMKTDGSYELRVTSDDGTENIYNFTDTNLLLHTVKTKFDKGIKGKYWKFGIANVMGADFEIDSLNVDIEVLQRRGGA